MARRRGQDEPPSRLADDADPELAEKVEPLDPTECRPLPKRSLALAALVSVVWIWLHWCASAVQSANGGPASDISLKYDVLSSWVQWSNWHLWGSSTAGDTMHQAIGTPPDPRLLDREVCAVAARLLAAGATSPRARVRVLDAGSGWGGTSFALASSLAGLGYGVEVDGLTLSGVQASHANAAAAERGLASAVRFHRRTFDDAQVLVAEAAAAADTASAAAHESGHAPGSESGFLFDLAVSIEALVHSPDLRRSLRALSSALKPGVSGIAAAHVIIVDDVLAEGDPAALAAIRLSLGGRAREGNADDHDPVLAAYRRYWAGHAGDTPFPLMESQWRSYLASAGLGGGGAGGGGAGGGLGGRGGRGGLGVTFVDLGAAHGLRLHGEGRLRLAAAGLGAALWLAQSAVPRCLLPGLESYLGTYVGAVARERLLAAGRIRYALIAASNGGTGEEPWPVPEA